MLETVERIRKDVIEPNATRWMDGTFPYDNMSVLAEAGVLAMAVPEEYGGMSATILDTVLVLEEIAKGCYVTAMAVLGEVGVQCRIISTYAPEPFKQKWLPAVASGDCILAVCMTEPNVGTDLGRMSTNATVHNDRVVINGTKTLKRATAFPASRRPAPITLWAASIWPRFSSTMSKCRRRT